MNEIQMDFKISRIKYMPREFIKAFVLFWKET